jgi:capsid protein
MNLLNKARTLLAKAISPAAFKQVERESRSRGMTPNEFNRAVVSAYHFYEGIKQSREHTRIPYYVGDSPETADSWARLEFISVARYLYKNDGLCRGAINDLARYTVGTGLRPISHASKPETAVAYEDYFNEWAFRADFTGKHHLDRLQFLWQIGEARDGDIGIVLTQDAATNDPRVQTIRGHRIGSFGANADGLTDGVRTDDFDRIISYRIQSRNGATRDIPAHSFILAYEAEDDDELRGMTVLQHGIKHARDKKDILGFEKVAVKKASAVAAVLKTRDGTVEESEWDDSDDSDDAEPTKLTLMQMQSGQVPVIGKDEELIWHDSSRPSPAFTGFLAFLIREIALGMGLPVEFIWDAAALGGSTQRFVLEKAERRFEERRCRFSKQVMNRIWGRVIANAIARGKLPEDPKKFDLSWQGPCALSVDAGRDEAADREAVKMGLMTEARYYGMRNQDWRKARKQVLSEADSLLTDATALAKKHNVTPEFALGLLRQSTPNGFTLSPAAPAPSKPEQKS